MYVLFLFVNYVWLLENNFNLNSQKVLLFSGKFSFIISLMIAYFQCHMVSFQCIAYVYMCLRFIASIFSHLFISLLFSALRERFCDFSCLYWLSLPQSLKGY